MKRKLLAAAILLTAVTSTYAAQGKGYREYGEEIHQSKGANFHVEEMPAGAFDSIAGNEKKTMRSGRARTKVPSKSGKVGYYENVDGYHDFIISNNTKVRQTYHLFISLRCEDMSFSDSRYVDVEPGGYYTRNDHSYGTVQKSSPGNYRIEGETKLSGESSDSSWDSGTLYISK